MPNPERDIARALTLSRRKWSLVASLLLVALVATLFFVLTAEPTPEDEDLVEQVAEQATNAAARAYYVYPESRDPNGVTAYRKITELESGTVGDPDLAEERAAQLRETFAETLVRIGDRYWKRPEGRPFATEYYAMALMFDSANETAKSRVRMTPVQLAELRRKAEEGDFTEAELEATRLIVALGQEDEEQALAAAAEVLEEGDAGSAQQDTLARRFIEKNPPKRPIARRPKNPRPAPPTPPKTPPDPPKSEAEPQLPEPPVASPRAGRGGAKDGGSEQRPAVAAELVQQGQAALRAGRLGEAETKFNQALAADYRSHAALMGLSDVHFERSAYEKSVRFARRAVRGARRNAGYRIRLGDALFKSLRYKEARDEYEKAKELGSSSADAHLAKVRQKLGQ